MTPFEAFALAFLLDCKTGIRFLRADAIERKGGNPSGWQIAAAVISSLVEMLVSIALFTYGCYLLITEGWK